MWVNIALVALALLCVAILAVAVWALRAARQAHRLVEQLERLCEIARIDAKEAVHRASQNGERLDQFFDEVGREVRTIPKPHQAGADRRRRARQN